METSAIFAFIFSELIVGVFVFMYWRRHRSLFSRAQGEFANAVRDHYRKGTLEHYMTDIMSGKESVHTGHRSLLAYLWVFLTGTIGFLIIYSVRRFTELGVVPRTFIGILVMLPFIALLAVGFAEEADDNKISSFEKASANQVLERIREGTIEHHMEELG